MNEKEKSATAATATLSAPYKSKHPFAAAFIDLGDHTAADALEALTDAMRAELQNDNAWEWVQRALPGATMKPGHAIGTLGELYRSFSRDQEYARFTSVLSKQHH